MILRFKPVYKERIWGGQNLKFKLNKIDLPAGSIGESWEISAHKEGESTVENGRFEGKKLSEIFKELGEEYFGGNSAKYEEFPLLIKFLDAAENLSVQVHPDNDYAKVHENSLGKEEIWYILDAEPGSKLVYGLKKGITKSEFEDAVHNDKVIQSLNYIEVQKDDVLFIPAGTVHAIGKGIQIAEIQQSSDITYRVFDYNRKDNGGNQRELHIQKSLDVINFDFEGDYFVDKELKQHENYSIVNYAKCPNFSMDLISFETQSPLEYELKHNSFEIFICIDGNLELKISSEDKLGMKSTQAYNLKRGDSVLLTVEQKYLIKGKGKVISTYV